MPEHQRQRFVDIGKIRFPLWIFENIFQIRTLEFWTKKLKDKIYRKTLSKNTYTLGDKSFSRRQFDQI